MRDIISMNKEELQEYANMELQKAGCRFITDNYSDLPEEFVTAAGYIKDNIYDCSYFKKDKYEIAFIEEYIPMSGMVWRIIIFDINKAKSKLEQVTSENNNINIKRIIGGSQVASIYYDNKDALGYMDTPYFEIFDGDDVERFLGHEYKELYSCLEDVLSRIIH